MARAGPGPAEAAEAAAEEAPRPAPAPPLSGEYERLPVRQLPGRGAADDAENRWWKRLGPPAFRKHQGAVTHVEFCPARPHHFLVTGGRQCVAYSGKTKRVKRTFARFSDTAYAAGGRGDGTAIAAGGETGFVQLFDAESRTVLRLFKGHKKAVHAVTFGGAGSRLHLASGGDDAAVRYWDVAEGAEVASLLGHTDYVRALAGDQENPHVFLSGSYDHSCRLWDVRARGCTMRVDHGSPVESVLVFPSGALAATAGGNYVCVWDLLAGGKLVAKMANHQKTVSCVRYASAAGPRSSRSARLLSSGLDGFVKVYELDTFKVTHSTKYPEPVLSFDISPTCSVMALGMQNSALGIRAAPKPMLGAAAAAAGGAEKRERWKPNVTAASYRYFLRGQSEQAGLHDVAMRKRKKANLKPFDRAFRKFQYKEALDAAVASNRLDVIYTVLEALLVRSAMEAALANRNEEALLPLLKVLIKHITDPRVADLLCTVAHMLLDQYAGVVGQSKAFDQKLKLLKERTCVELRNQRQLMALQGMTESILLGGQAVGERMNE